MGNPLWFIIWLLILICVAFPVAGICCWFYIIVYPLEVCIPALKDLNDILLSGVQFTHFSAKSMMECKPLCS